MDAKLTIKLDEDVIEQAKVYAKKQHTSLSRLIENQLRRLVSKEKKEFEFSPLVKSLIGVLDLPEDFDFKQSYTEYLEKKYR